jgi:uncharacterized protein (DUF433 family)
LALLPAGGDPMLDDMRIRVKAIGEQVRELRGHL